MYVSMGLDGRGVDSNVDESIAGLMSASTLQRTELSTGLHGMIYHEVRGSTTNKPRGRQHKTELAGQRAAGER